MKLSIVIVCWNDRELIEDCLQSIFEQTKDIEFEVIVSDNGSADDSVQFIKDNYPQVLVIENGKNLGFAKGNNVGIREARGEYVLILNPDTIVHDRAFEKWIKYADQHPEAGAYGCRVLNPDGSFQNCARPMPTVWRYFVWALYLHGLGRFLNLFLATTYFGWDGTTEREVDFQAGCCLMVRSEVLKQVGAFDERFFYHFEETDLCYRIWKAGYPIAFFPGAEITHLGGQSVGRFPVRFELEKYRNRYRFFYKHYGLKGAKRIRWISLVHIRVRQIGYGFVRLFKSNTALNNRMDMYRKTFQWNKYLDPVRFLESGEEPDVGFEPLAPAPNMMEEPVSNFGSGS